MDREKIIEFYSKYSASFDNKIGTLDLYNKSYKDFVDKSKVKNNLLDLACGPGNVSAFILDLLPNIDITCVDLSDKMLDLAKAKIKNGKFYLSDILDLQIPVIQYDLIICAFGLPYIEKSELDKFIQEVDRFSHKDTCLYVSCMQGDKSEVEQMSFADLDKVLVHYHSKTEIINKFNKFGYELIDYSEQDYLEPTGETTIDMIFNFKKK